MVPARQTWVILGSFLIQGIVINIMQFSFTFFLAEMCFLFLKNTVVFHRTLFM